MVLKDRKMRNYEWSGSKAVESGKRIRILYGDDKEEQEVKSFTLPTFSIGVVKAKVDMSMVLRITTDSDKLTGAQLKSIDDQSNDESSPY